MPKYTLVVKTYQKEVRGRTKLCGIITIKGGDVLQKEMDKSTLKELSRSLRSGGLLPTDIEITKKCTVEFPYISKEPLKAKKIERTITASNFVAAMADKDKEQVSDKTFRKFFQDNLQFVIYEGCE